ncbi:MAG: hypothetical protein CML13_07780 [Puniceicoccaceae bacterium]|nr:hypothetical protein [Puniceicoccaceae bacterium]|tara:strand:+ start:10014 stop:10568 length:555 start_codon:yes stop_codon:yes gene_type:complete
MGLFDTVRFDKPLRVPEWEQPVVDMQTKHFGNSMQTYTIGSILPESPVRIGVVEDSLWCAPEQADDPGRTHPVYFAIWHRILAGVFLDVEQAEECLRTVDRLDLIAWLERAQTESQRWESRFRHLYTDISALHRHQTEGEPAAEREALLRGLVIRLPDDILQADDPLALILKMHAKEEPGTEGE